MIYVWFIDDDTVAVRADKYTAEFVGVCRAIASGTFNKRLNAWVYPVAALPDIAEAFKGKKVKLGKDVKDTLSSLRYRDDMLEGIKQGRVKLDKHKFLMEHQKKCRTIARYFNKFALYLDVGTGKTITALQIMEDKGAKFLVLCPKSLIKTAWWKDQKDFYPGLRLMPISRNMKAGDYLELFGLWGIAPPKGRVAAKRLKEELLPHAQAYIINPESFKNDIKEIEQLGIQGLVIDESTIIKNPTSQITKDVTAFANKLDYVYLLSGNPAPNSIMDYFSQMRVIDPAILGTSFYKFRDTYFDAVGYMGYDYVPKPGVQEEITRRISKRAIFVDRHDCIDLPEQTEIIRSIELPTKARSTYSSMEKALIAYLKDSVVSASTKAVSLMKLRQIASGFIITEVGEIEHIHNAKQIELLDVLEEIGNKQVLIWCEFQEEVRSLVKLLEDKGKTVVTAYGGTKDTDKSVFAFMNGEAQYLIAHPETLKYGVTLTNCNYMVFYSISYSYDAFYQATARIYRKGQTKPCTNIILQVEDSIDEAMYNTIKRKGDDADFILEMIKRG